MEFVNIGSVLKKIAKFIVGWCSNKSPNYGIYRSVTLTDDEIEKQEYKKYLGGGRKSWESRGLFQLYFLQEMGMTQSAKVLDIGCGPGRGGKHLLGFLNRGNYYGIDNNPDFIKAASVMVKKEKLEGKKPQFWVVDDFDVNKIGVKFDYVMAFSVLNHCDFEERSVFFDKIHDALSEDGKLYISHAWWFDPSYLKNSKVVSTYRFGPGAFEIDKFGWGEKDGILPIIELRKKV